MDVQTSNGDDKFLSADFFNASLTFLCAAGFDCGGWSDRLTVLFCLLGEKLDRVTCDKYLEQECIVNFSFFWQLCWITFYDNLYFYHLCKCCILLRYVLVFLPHIIFMWQKISSLTIKIITELIFSLDRSEVQERFCAGKRVCNFTVKWRCYFVIRIWFDLIWFGTHHVHRITHESLKTYFQCGPWWRVVSKSGWWSPR